METVKQVSNKNWKDGIKKLIDQINSEEVLTYIYIIVNDILTELKEEE